MKTTNRLAITALATWLYALSAQAQIEANVPIARLLATPDRYDGKEISTSGVLRLGRGVTAIYIDAGSANAEVTANALVILSNHRSLSENEVKAANGQYVLVFGRFSSSSPQPRGYSGILENVNALRAYPLLKELPAGRVEAPTATSVHVDYSELADDCSRKVERLLRGALSKAPDFASIHEMTMWLAVQLPSEISARFVEAGHAVSHSLAEQERIGVIHGAFWNMQALSELLLAQSNRFNGIAGCALTDDMGVTREVLQDQLFIALDLRDKAVERSMSVLGVSDPYYEKAIIMDGIFLDAAGVTWRDDQIAQLAKFRLEPPSAAQ